MLLIGNGRMGSALSTRFSPRFDLAVVDPAHAPDYKSTHCKNLEDIHERYDYITFAVKPFALPEVISKLNRSTYDESTEILSIVAGVKRDFYKAKLGDDMNIAIMMGNLAVKLGKGVIALNSKTKHDFLTDCGQVIYTNDETEIDKFCAFIGSGPGFCYAIMEMMYDAVEKLEFQTEMDKRKVIIGIFEGAIEYLKDNKRSFEDNKNFVTTPQGTTMAGLAELERAKEAFDKTFLKAYLRAAELGEIVRKSL